jgi:hypothetical protein
MRSHPEVMKLAVLSGAVLAVLGAGGLTSSVLTAGPPPPSVADEAAHDPAARTGGPDDRQKAERHAAQRAFVAAKNEWTACVAEAAPAREAETGRFDPEEACGTKPHPHGEKTPGRSDDGPARGQGRPPWAGGPGSRTAEPPGHANRDGAASRR